MLNNLQQLKQKTDSLEQDIIRSLLGEADYLKEQIRVDNDETMNLRECLIALGKVLAYGDTLGIHLKMETWAVRYYLDLVMAGQNDFEPRSKAIKALNKVLAEVGADS